MKKIIAGIGILLIMGCANVKYTTPDGKEFKYSRIGNQKIGNFKAKVNRDGTVDIELKNQESETQIAETLLNLSEVAKKMGGIP